MLDLRSVELAMNIAPASIFFVKDREGRYISSNQGHIDMCGKHTSNEVMGHTTDEFFSRELVSRYRCMDRVVLDGTTLLDRFDHLTDAQNNPVWTLYSRKSVGVQNGDLAIMGISRILPQFRNSDRVYRRLHLATERIAEHLDDRLDMKTLADLCGCSVSQIGRDFAGVLAMSPTGYQAKLRLQHMKDRIKAGHSLSTIAIDCGFSEQSAMSRFFKKHTTMTITDFVQSEFAIH